MKKLSIFLLLPLLLLISCGGGNTYTMETYYSNSKGTGDTSMVTEKDNISADSDSAAYVKAQEKFNALMVKSGDKHGLPIKFTVRNNDGNFVVAPGMDSASVEKQMYPNQKPLVGE